MLRSFLHGLFLLYLLQTNMLLPFGNFSLSIKKSMNNSILSKLPLKNGARLSLITLGLMLVLSACSDTEPTQKKEAVVEKKLSNEDSMMAEIKAIDEEAESSGKLVSSLRYTKENGAVVLVHAHLTDDDNMIKIDEEYNEGNNGSYGTNTFYLKGGKIFAVREYFEDQTDKKAPKFVERLSFYSIKGKESKIQKTIEKRVDFEEEIENIDFKPVALHEVKIDRAMDALNQRGEFENTFQGFVKVQAFNYLVIGSPQKDGYTSAVRINSDDEFTLTLLNNQRKLLNRKIEVSFENVMDPDGFEYQSYIQGSFVQ